MHSPKEFQHIIEQELLQLPVGDHPAELYEPIRYMLSLGGKRIRPVLTLMAAELFGADHRIALKTALGIEVFHNFTLLHDDIMDKAPLRRGQATVHTRWNPDIAILSGDTMFVRACQLVMQADPGFLQPVMNRFLQTAAEVCEGQQLDMNFESASDVQIADYLHMIGLKTAVLLGCALECGAVLGGASDPDAQHCYDLGKDLGTAFQLLDDILDVYGDAEKFGKQTGGDILSNKKTFLLLTALADAKGAAADELQRWLRMKDANPAGKVSAVKAIYDELRIRDKAQAAMQEYFNRAMHSLAQINVPAERKVPLQELAKALMVREK